jgi:hypothetical protein
MLMDDNNNHYTIEKKVLKKNLKASKITVYTGYIIVKFKGKYLYSEFSNITRINEKDAMEDARKILE